MKGGGGGGRVSEEDMERTASTPVIEAHSEYHFHLFLSVFTIFELHYNFSSQNLAHKK